MVYRVRQRHGHLSQRDQSNLRAPSRVAGTRSINQ